MTVKKNRRGMATRAIHAGQHPDPTTGAVMPPIYTASTYVQDSPGVHKGYEYSRTHNPTRQAFERCIADLESGSHGFAFASGMAATGTVLELLDSGDHVVAMDDLYGGTYRLFENVRKRSAGLDFTFADLAEEGALEAAVTDKTRMIWVETPTNPLLKLVDLAVVARFAKERGILTVCDNTFASPVVQRPLELGMDIVLHSTTKYIGGHSDVVGGVVVVDDAGLAEKIGYLSNSIGGVASPFDSYMTLRSLKTLPLRMQRHNENAMAVAEYLAGHEGVEKLIYPGLESHPQHDLARRQMDGFSGMVTAVLKGDLARTRKVLERLEVFQLAESLGGVESLVNHPAIMTHASIPEAERERLGISNSLIRFSVGIEDPEDLIADLAQALDPS